VVAKIAGHGQRAHALRPHVAEVRRWPLVRPLAGRARSSRA
jgi:hypothetical protein